MTTTAEAIATALHSQIEAALSVSGPAADVGDGVVEDADAELPDAGAINIVMLDRGVAEDMNGEGPHFRTAEFQIEFLVDGDDSATRRTRMRALLDAVEAACDSDRTLGGIVLDMLLEPTDPDQIEVRGADDASTESATLFIDYESEGRL